MTNAAFAVALGVLVTAAQPLAATELPSRAPGLWEMTLTRNGQKTVEKRCVLPDETNALVSALETGGDCKRKLSQDGDAYVAETDCGLGAITVKGRTRFTGDFKARIAATFETSVAGTDGKVVAPPSTATLEGARVGECPAEGGK